MGENRSSQSRKWLANQKVPFRWNKKKVVIVMFFWDSEVCGFFLCLSLFCFGWTWEQVIVENWISEPWHVMMFVVVGWLLRWLVVNEQTVLL